jgi:hypothetical protein
MAALGASACGGEVGDGTDPSGGPGGVGTGGVSTGGVSTGGVPAGGTGNVGGTPMVDSGPEIGNGCVPNAFQCCSKEECLSPEDAWASANQWNTGGGVAGADGGTKAPCPTAGEMGSGLCYWYSGGTFSNGMCCYEYYSGSCCGRPMLVDGRALVAAVRVGEEWVDPVLGELMPIDHETRLVIAREWLEDARLEHASIASFARFVLELLQHGAPPELVQDAQRALGDEVKHAKLCFTLASLYAGRPLGPTSLELPPFGIRSLAEAAAAAVEEGCVGETLAVFQAEAQAENARDSEVRAALATIASDEARHSELAWSFVRWAIEEGGSEVARAVEEAFSRAIARVRTAAPSPSPNCNIDLLHAHGRLTPPELRASHLAALDTLVEPARRALCDRQKLVA